MSPFGRKVSLRRRTFLVFLANQTPTVVGAIALAVVSINVFARAADTPDAVKAQLIETTRHLLDAIAPGDKAPWAKVMAEECLYSDENGTTMTKAKFLEELGPLPAGYSGNMKLEKPQFILAGDTAILAYELNEQETVFGQELHARYHATDTWVRRDGQWRMIASQVVRTIEEKLLPQVEAVGDASKPGHWFAIQDRVAARDQVTQRQGKSQMQRGQA